MIKQLIAKVKENATDDWNLVAGLEIAVIELQENSNEFLVLRPIQLDQMEKFFKVMHETFGKNEFYEDYDYFVCYAVSEDCDDILLTITKENIEELRQATKKDVLIHNKNLEILKKNHNWYKYKN
ncbi:hypothetical protein CBE01nite_35390 [Clostridium beijerinckii]|uniref:Uncharacterized protein n=1 Tax=Clostridium beijerinckii TaxID=1520 RepID=A0AB74VHB2_CLOBE|nr:hypothetical protein [Clostridium beijerinckii]NRZ25149.1 hypothetical protein [Clostridium beijerinckii]NYB99863.1 hypothetical protein [Clostridium beijerinckii]OOM26486.1 hypothetical protein CLBEI_10800 [Clostridium beijerinckii]QUN35937.1 hypothetical protein KEC93_03655 [Clostridium beijerinckii]SQB13380.1 Uncharacterised protein [Clostridium beijerinckii]